MAKMAKMAKMEEKKQKEKEKKDKNFDVLENWLWKWIFVLILRLTISYLRSYDRKTPFTPPSPKEKLKKPKN